MEKFLFEKIFCWKKVFVGKHFLLEKIFCWEKVFVGKKFLLEKSFWKKKILLGKTSCWKNIFPGKDFLLENIFCWKNVFAGKDFLLEKNFCWQNVFVVKKFLLEKSFCWKNDFVGKMFLLEKIFCWKKFVVGKDFLLQKNCCWKKNFGGEDVLLEKEISRFRRTALGGSGGLGSSGLEGGQAPVSGLKKAMRSGLLVMLCDADEEAVDWAVEGRPSAGPAGSSRTVCSVGASSRAAVLWYRKTCPAAVSWAEGGAVPWTRGCGRGVGGGHPSCTWSAAPPPPPPSTPPLFSVSGTVCIWRFNGTENTDALGPYGGVHCLWFAFVCFVIRSNPLQRTAINLQRTASNLRQPASHLQ